MIRFHAGSVGETAELGKKLGRILQKGDDVCLTGELGTGKTALTGGIAAGLEIGGYITSPTFTIVNEYEGRLPLYHFDVYRIGGPEEMFDTGYDEYIGGDGVTVIEWADIIKEILPEERIEINIEKDDRDDMDSRLITISFIGSRYAEYEGRLADEIPCR
ncbi:MAG: tRNA (adenosine(37)-N6)-threonylcarbamoyltransferase complex ATPase subunit type 1 TsaE [Clostridiaceae bacterium]|jgi:tRNA threonylcarbamoyladenosine biosynthesis protein TsaE|nr:tRNA (adenosine(37)-N6)-threonylcarbamoyltransferase complex ATPase subunit type 1 TsaE [Clostridiaceae bacterium]